VSFIFQLRDSKIDFVVCDLPELNTLTLGIFATIAQSERETISQRTKAALAVKKANGIKLGSPVATFTNDMRVEARQALRGKALSNPNNRRAISMIGTLREKGYGYKRIAEYLNDNGFRTARNCLFQPQTVRQMIIAYIQ
jgi:DNA invertase Pin-like site-specific DNA recombinase